MNLRLLQLGDSALPIGGYSHSWGLEAAVEQGLIRDPAALERWVRHWLEEVVAPLEGVIVAAVCRAASAGEEGEVARANALLSASLVPATLYDASRQMGEQLRALAESWPWSSLAASALGRRSGEREPPALDWHHAVVFGVLAAAANAAPGEAVTVFLHQAALGLINAGVRAVPIGHTHGQQILARLQDDILRLAEEVQERDLETAGAGCPFYEILCYEQTQLYTRIFRS